MNLIRQELELPPVNPNEISHFVTRWSKATGSEKANYQLFLTELCTLLHLPQPDPASDVTASNSYVFERRVDIANADGSHNKGFIDLYRRDCFVLEAKQSGKGLDTAGWDKAMLAAHSQADRYVRALPSDEGRPPYIVVTDVGRSIELYAEFTRTGGTYTPYPDPSSHRIRIDDLAKPEVQDRLRRLWLAPESLDTSKFAAEVTREVSYKLADLAKSLEASDFEIERVAHFLKRCLFTMFAEDVGLIEERSYTLLLEKLKEHPEHFADSMTSLWHTMNTGGFEGQLMQKLPQFNGGLFKSIEPIPLNADQIQLLLDAAKADWRFVEPAIFGTLLERALDPRERHKLGAHYTPRAYVERLVMPTIIEPLREQWSIVQAAAEMHIQNEKPDKALLELRNFHHQLCETKILDPACGSGNFLYVALEHMKRLEGEVLNVISDLSSGQVGFDTEGLTVDPHQFLGIEINPRAAAVAELVLWIGYLQWHYRIHGILNIPEPVLRDFKNVECRDALIEYDSRASMLDDGGQPVTIWDGISYKESPVTGELVPDENGRTHVYEYVNPRKSQWPESDYIVGNPPFIGNKRIRTALGDGYAAAIRQAFNGDVPDSSDFVMYWWYLSGQRLVTKRSKQFGLITTNSITQEFNQRTVKSLLETGAVALTFAVPDHPWVDSVDGADVRIAMTVASSVQIGTERAGTLITVLAESTNDPHDAVQKTQSRNGIIFSNLRVGANLSSAAELIANSGISNRGMIPHGEHFLVTKAQASKLDKGALARPYRNNKDLVAINRNHFILDTFGLSEAQLNASHPETWQWLYQRVKPARDQNKRKSVREKWWLFAEPRKVLRAANTGLARYIVTGQTGKHRIFQFLGISVVPDDKLIAISLEKSASLGILQSRPHNCWSLALGGRMGVGNDPVYVKSLCFETFPFPALTDTQANTIGTLAERIDAHRKHKQTEHDELTLTGMYNVLEKLRTGESLTVKEKSIHERGLVSLLKELHDDLDRAVFDAYGWIDLGDALVGLPGATTPFPGKSEAQAEAEEELLKRLVELNHQRAAEEAQGHVCWLRPEYQAPNETQQDIEMGTEAGVPAIVAARTAKKATFPKEMHEQIRIVLDQLQTGPMEVDALAANFKRKPVKSVTAVLSALEVLGKAKQEGTVWRV